ncbi:MAG: competence/damage-inducible protein A [Phycisphaerales bacterium]|nr:competence/damage-inducible protein A [Phycisphaerales bacterium]
MNAIIISVGTELTSGQTVDTNSAWLSSKLAEIGIPVLLHVTAPDDVEPLSRQIETACAQADLVLVTGGLGPTADDLTREALAQVMGVELQIDPALAEQVRAFFARLNRPMPEANLVQAMLPVGSRPLENTCGTAPGIHTRIGSTKVFVMPGVPREMQIMYEQFVLPQLPRQDTGSVILNAVLYCFGAGESEIGQSIYDLMRRGRNPLVGTTAKQGIIGIRILARASTAIEARNLLEDEIKEIRHRLGPLVFGRDDETLAHAVASRMIANNKTLATAESCTGGLIAKTLTDIPGSSAFYSQGWITYANEAKIRLLNVPADLIESHGAVSRPVAAAMAVNARRLAETDYAISVTGIAGPAGGTPDKPVGLVYVGLAEPNHCEVTQLRLGNHLNREEIRWRTTCTVLNFLRLRLMTDR